MILASALLCNIQNPASGLARVLDQRTRTYAVHLEIANDDSSSTSDYDIVLSPKRPERAKKGEQPAKPGIYIMRLENLVWKAADTTKRKSLFGAGPLTFAEEGVPDGFGTVGWTLSPLLGFYVPGGDSPVLTDISVVRTDPNTGWSVEGTARLQLATSAGQTMSMSGKLVAPSATEYKFSLESNLDPQSGWPIAGKGHLENATSRIDYTLKRL